MTRTLYLTTIQIASSQALYEHLETDSSDIPLRQELASAVLRRLADEVDDDDVATVMTVCSREVPRSAAPTSRLLVDLEVQEKEIARSKIDTLAAERLAEKIRDSVRATGVIKVGVTVVPSPWLNATVRVEREGTTSSDGHRYLEVKLVDLSDGETEEEVADASLWSVDFYHSSGDSPFRLGNRMPLLVAAGAAASIASYSIGHPK